MSAASIDALYYITHIDNIESIIRYGILSHRKIVEDSINHSKIYAGKLDPEKHSRKVAASRTLNDFAGLYFEPRNPMLYQAIQDFSPEEIVIFSLKEEILGQQNAYVTSGNASHPDSEIIPISRATDILNAVKRDTLGREWWPDSGDSKIKMLAECLVLESVPPWLIDSIYVANQEVEYNIKDSLRNIDIPIIPQPNMFFQPSDKFDLTDNITIVKGDPFYSGLQTIAVGVNLEAGLVIGKALRIKHQYPDVFQQYLEACQNGSLYIGKPLLVKRGNSNRNNQEDNSDTWFLLVPTKSKAKENANLSAIGHGMKWISKNWKNEGIKSLVIPAFGCGYSKLNWRDVGPLMCRYLSALEIPVWIYLPVDKKIPDEYLTPEFLLRDEVSETSYY